MKYNNQQLTLLIEQIIKEELNQQEDIVKYWKNKIKDNEILKKMFYKMYYILFGKKITNIKENLEDIKEKFPKIFSLLTRKEIIKREEILIFLFSLSDWIQYNHKEQLKILKDYKQILNFLNPIREINKYNYLFRGLSIKINKPGNQKVEYKDINIGSSWTSDIEIAKSFGMGGSTIGVKKEKLKNPILWEFSNDSELINSLFFEDFMEEKEWVYSIKSPIVVDLYSDSSTQQSIREDGEQNNYGFIQLPQEGKPIVINNTKVR